MRPHQNEHCTTFIRLSMVAASILFLAGLPGCDRDDDATKDYQQRQEFFKQIGRLHRNYFVGDLNRSRQSLHGAIQLFEDANCLKKDELAFGLLLDYARWQVIETRAGNEALAEAYLLKARYWRLIELESKGDSPEEAMKKVDSLTAQKCVEMVDLFGKEARKKITKPICPYPDKSMRLIPYQGRRNIAAAASAKRSPCCVS